MGIQLVEADAGTGKTYSIASLVSSPGRGGRPAGFRDSRGDLYPCRHRRTAGSDPRQAPGRPAVTLQAGQERRQSSVDYLLTEGPPEPVMRDRLNAALAGFDQAGDIHHPRFLPAGTCARYPLATDSQYPGCSLEPSNGRLHTQHRLWISGDGNWKSLDTWKLNAVLQSAGRRRKGFAEGCFTPCLAATTHRPQCASRRRLTLRAPLRTGDSLLVAFEKSLARNP